MSKVVYIFAYIGIWLLAIMPLEILYKISDCLYLFVYKIVGYRKNVVRENLKNSFPEKTKEELETIEHKFYHYICDYMLESMKMLLLSKKELFRRLTFHNTDQSVFLFTSDSIWETLEEEKLNEIRGVFSLTDFRCLHQRDGETVQKFIKHLDAAMSKTYPNGFNKDNIEYTTLSNEKVILLNYTSGTTGFSKGVMLTGNNLAGNVTYGIRTELLKRGDCVLSFLPLAHAYGCAFDFLTATAVGTHVTLLGKTPSPKI